MNNEHSLEQAGFLSTLSSKKYIEEQKEAHESPLHQTGLDLMSQLADITTSAMLISEENLEKKPDLFQKNCFEEKRTSLIAENISLEDLSLELTRNTKNQLIGTINLFIYDFRKYAKDTKASKTQVYLIEEMLDDLLNDEIVIKNAFTLYKGLARFFHFRGIDVSFFETILNLKEYEVKNMHLRD